MNLIDLLEQHCREHRALQAEVESLRAHQVTYLAIIKTIVLQNGGEMNFEEGYAAGKEEKRTLFIGAKQLSLE